MRFYTQQHKHYCGSDLHARSMYVCLLDQAGTKLVHKNLPTTPEAFLRVIAPYREDVGVAVECIFTWYWLSDLCAREGIPFVLGHALYMKAIHGGKAKNDKIDAHKIAVLLRGGMIPMAYVYPPEMRATRDLLRRRCHLARKRAELLAHIHNTNSQYNLPEIGKRLGTSGKKIGNVHLRWAFAEAAVLFIRQSQPGKEYFAKLEHKHGKAKALTVLAHKVGRAVYYMLTREQAFDLQRFVSA